MRSTFVAVGLSLTLAMGFARPDSLSASQPSTTSGTTGGGHVDGARRLSAGNEEGVLSPSMHPSMNPSGHPPGPSSGRGSSLDARTERAMSEDGGGWTTTAARVLLLYSLLGLGSLFASTALLALRKPRD